MAERNALARVVDSPTFTTIIVTTIAVNAAVLGLQTYQGIEDRWGDVLFAINGVCLGIFLVELAIRIASYWPRPLAFFRNGWNVFDFIVILAVFVPGIRENSTLLRLLRLLRVVRIVRLLPDLRVLLLGIWRSIPPLASIGAVTAIEISRVLSHRAVEKDGRRGGGCEERRAERRIVRGPGGPEEERHHRRRRTRSSSSTRPAGSRRA